MLCWYTSFLSESQTECLDLHLPVHAPARLQPLQVSSTLSMLNMAKSKSCPNQSSPGQNCRKFMEICDGSTAAWFNLCHLVPNVRVDLIPGFWCTLALTSIISHRCPSDEFGSSISSAIFLWASLVVIRCDQHVLNWLDLLALWLMLGLR